MRIRIIKDIDEFQLLEKDWDKIYSQNKEYSVFQSFDFNYYSWKHELISDNKNQLTITVITINESVVAIFPFYIDSNKKLRFINDIHFDFCDFISIESINFSRVYNYLKQEVDFKSIRLINVKQEANIYKVVKEMNIKNKVFLSISEYSFLNIDKGAFPYNVLHYRSHQKHRINKALRKNKEKQSIIVSYQQHSFPKKEILLLKEIMISLGIRKDNFLTNERLLLIECLYNSGIIILHITRDKDKINSINILLKQSTSKFIFWIDLFDDSKMINIFSYINFMKSISLEQSVNINFGRGAYNFKTTNFKPEIQQLFAVFIFSSKFQKLSFLLFMNVKCIIKTIYKKIKK